MTHATERVVLSGLHTAGYDDALFAEDIEEMRLLCPTAGAEIVATAIQKRDRPTASTFLGSGKLDEIRTLMATHDAGTLVVDASLSPGQVRNMEEIVKGKVIDRGQLILDIFAQRALTLEGRLQIELAQLHYLIPRLRGLWTHLERQKGGIGLKGPGEKQLELDRRRIEDARSSL